MPSEKFPNFGYTTFVYGKAKLLEHITDTNLKQEQSIIIELMGKVGE